MAAITIRLEQASGIEPKTANGLADAMPEDIPLAGANESHAKLTSMVYLRSALADAMKLKKISIRYLGGDVWLYLDSPLKQGESPPWNPISLPEVKRGKLLSWTSKMGAPSFSLPAGSPSMGGSCVGAAGGQTITSIQQYHKQKKHVLQVVGQNYAPEQAICQNCYAEGGQYATGNVQVYQLMRFAWAQGAVQDGSFAEVMGWAVRQASYYLNGKGLTNAKDDDGNPILDVTTGEPLRVASVPELDGKRYFRIHDSGDFFSPDYLAAWKLVADQNPDITFWAPSRVWAVPSMREAVNVINATPKNLIIRPSAYAINAPCPKDLGPGWAQGTTVFSEQAQVALPLEGERPYDWNCKAYETASQVATCRDAESPDGSIGCRACWKRSDLSVNYTLH